jgi:predicted secreted protein
MGIFEAFVVFFMSWWVIFLPTLSAGTVIPGTEGGAPVAVRWRWKIAIATGGAALVTFLLWLALHMHWLDFMAERS